jgi:deoxyhypusine synthase
MEGAQEAAMDKVRDIELEGGMTASDMVRRMAGIGLQASGLEKAAGIIADMKRNRARIYLTFTSNMVTSGLRGIFAQMIRLGLADVVVTTTGAIEEDMMKAMGEEFLIGSFGEDDAALHERGMNRIGNLMIGTDSYVKFEDAVLPMIRRIYEKKKRLPVNELLHEIGLMLEDGGSFLRQAALKGIPVFCPAIADGSLGFQLHMFQQDHPDFVVDVIKDYSAMLSSSSYDDRKGVIALGGGVSKHYAIFGLLLNGGCDYAVYLTTSSPHSGSMGGATTGEARTWGKLKVDARDATVIGDASVTFPLVMARTMDMLREEGLIGDG